MSFWYQTGIALGVLFALVIVFIIIHRKYWSPKDTTNIQPKQSRSFNVRSLAVGLALIALVVIVYWLAAELFYWSLDQFEYFKEYSRGEMVVGGLIAAGLLLLLLLQFRFYLAALALIIAVYAALVFAFDFEVTLPWQDPWEFQGLHNEEETRFRYVATTADADPLVIRGIDGDQVLCSFTDSYHYSTPLRVRDFSRESGWSEIYIRPKGGTEKTKFPDHVTSTRDWMFYPDPAVKGPEDPFVMRAAIVNRDTWLGNRKEDPCRGVFD